jgi:hypothetical protein
MSDARMNPPSEALDLQRDGTDFADAPHFASIQRLPGPQSSTGA